MFTKWINKPINYKEEDGTVEITTGAVTDFFCDPVVGSVKHNSPLYCIDASENFIFECKVEPGFIATYDAGTILLYFDETHWMKLCFERTDMGHNAVVSVVTRGVSDDANGEKITAESLWLKMCRKGNAVGFYYSLDNVEWRMVRLFNFESDNKNAYIGIEAQSPVGDGCTVAFSDIKYSQNEYVKDFRKGV